MTNKTSNLKTKIGIFVISLLLQSTGAVAMVISGAANAFPDASTSKIQLIYSLITLVAMLSNLAAGKLAGIFTKKTLIIIAYLMQLAGGMVGYFLHDSLLMLYFASVLIGLCSGMIIPLCSALIAEHFEGPERASVMGVQSLFVNGGAIIVNMLAGILAAKYWPGAYMIFVATIPVIIVCALLIPKGEVDKRVIGEKVKMFNSFLIMVIVQGMLFGLCWATFMTNAALYVFDLGVGNEAQTGYLLMTQALGCVLMGLVLPKVIKITGKYCFVLASSLAALALWMLYFSANLPMLLVSSLVLGLGFGLFLPAANTLIPNNVHPSMITMSISIFCALFSVGSFLNPYLITLGAAAFNGSIATRFMIAAIIQSINLIVSLIAVKKIAIRQAGIRSLEA